MSENRINRRKLLTSAAAVGGLSLGLSLVPTGAQAAPLASRRTRRSEATWENLVEKSSFNSLTAFKAKWNYNYPWGDSHNGAAKMDPGQVSLSGGVLTLKATRLSQSLGPSPSPPHAPRWYLSGAVHAKPQIIVNDQFPEYDIEGEFSVQAGPGIWPAFWTNGTPWPPESDILEYVGDSTNKFNTWNRDMETQRTLVEVRDPQFWYRYRVWMYKEGNDVKLEYYFGKVTDGVNYVGTHTGYGWVGVPQTIIINLQMGSYASELEAPGDPGWEDQRPGPDGDTYFRARNVWFGRTRAW
ncbi:glycoside hydrolase [Nonomuraea sp. SYSU D8015]|uniref:glycoside hydrolase n=1 Tax=Nonomuraea sp. SYSU D8015 TaxID=2593644 RepID=UPI0016606560|nr:glycoside hydrolase [Nonomuraea sp. SYSU D8015]